MKKKNNIRRVVGSLALAASTATLAASPDDSQRFNDYWSPGKPSLAACKSPLLVGTPLVLPRCMQASNVLIRLQKLQDIATMNDGNRAAAQPGYQASLDYVRSTLERAGYRVTIQAFPFTSYEPKGPGTLSALVPVPANYIWDEDFTYLSQTEAGDVSAAVVPVDLALGAGNASSSGCEAEDFAAFPAGSIALIQRGTCNFQQKAENAATAGAVGVVIFNQGNADDRMGLMNATLGDTYAGGVPVLFGTYALGAGWAQTAGLQVRMVADVERRRTQTHNLIAETRRGNPNNVVMVGAHLDSVGEGAGINDNGSGSAAVLEMAVLMSKAHPFNKVRFAWWGAEESGLVGSTFYASQLPAAQKKQIKAYLNFDMIGSPNFGNFIYDGDGSDFGLQGPPGSAAIERLLGAYFNLRGKPAEGTEIDFRSDYAQFFEEGIAFGGLFTGAEDLKSEEQAQKFGGAANQPFDPCYHAACDNLANINSDSLELHGDAMAFATSWLSLSTQIIDDEIAAAETAAPGRSAKQSVRNVERWGRYFVK
jgi:Zn-dependent M28 family amino/carboxypeptidase